MGAMIGVCGLRIFAWGKSINFAQGRKGESMRQIGGKGAGGENTVIALLEAY